MTIFAVSTHPRNTKNRHAETHPPLTRSRPSGGRSNLIEPKLNIPRASRDLYPPQPGKDPGSPLLACREKLRPGTREERVVREALARVPHRRKTKNRRAAATHRSPRLVIPSPVTARHRNHGPTTSVNTRDARSAESARQATHICCAELCRGWPPYYSRSTIASVAMTERNLVRIPLRHAQPRLQHADLIEIGALDAAGVAAASVACCQEMQLISAQLSAATVTRCRAH